jgi:hypothetical protein
MITTNAFPNKDLFTEEGWAQFTSGFLVGAFGGAGFAYLVLLNLF